MNIFFTILLIFIEIILTVIIVRKINSLRFKISTVEKDINNKAEVIIKNISDIKINLIKINKIVNALTSQKYVRIKNYLTTILKLVRFILFIKSIQLGKKI